MSPARIRFLQRAVHLWLAGYLLSALPLAEWLWDHPVSPALPVPGPLAMLMDVFGTLPPGMLALPGAVVLLLFAVYGLWREQPVWMAFLSWMLFASLVHRAWLASSGGLLLMQNVLLWMVLIRARSSGPWSVGLSALGLWAVRLQLCLAYLVTGLHKLTGTAWIEGTAVGLVASDPQYGPRLLASVPVGAALLTWAWLLFQFAFPVLVWWRRARKPLFIAGAVFHVCTAWWVGIPEMGLAFIACYAAWGPFSSGRGEERADGAAA